MPESLPILRARRKRRLSGQEAAAGRRRSLLLGLGAFASLIGAALILSIALAYADLTRELPSVDILPQLLNPPGGLLLQPTRIYDSSGTHLLFTFAPDGSSRRYIPLAESNPQHIPASLAAAVVAMVDPQFWNHSGYVVNGTDNPELHPTIAQRLAVDLLLYDEKPSLKRALRERLLAAQLTARYGRIQVLEWYLNSVHLGRYAYGVDAAARLYFGKSVTDLSLAEMAMLAGTIEAPALNPLDAPSVALQRGREVIRLLAELDMVDPDQEDRALAEAPIIQPSDFNTQAGSSAEGAFINLALTQIDSRFARARIERGGLTIITTLDVELQHELVCTTEVFAARLAGQPDPELDCEAARWLPSQPPGITVLDASTSALILDPVNGRILALAGETFQARTTPLFSPHDPGSTLDAFVYLTGFTRGLSPGTLVWDIPGQVDVENADAQYHGPMRLRLALANGYRVPAAMLENQMGRENVSRIADSFGIAFEGPASLLSLAGAFGALDTQGVYFGQDLNQGGFLPAAVLRVESLAGSTWLDWSIPQAKPVVASGLAYLMTNALSDETARWPSLGTPNILEIDRPAAVKLGVSENGLEAWAIGYTPYRLVATWTGSHSSGRLTPRSTAVLYSGLMQYASRDLVPSAWPIPAGVTTLNVCDPSGLLPSPDCPDVVGEVFLTGNEPHQPDNLYHKFLINRETGLLATVFTPPELVEDRLFMLFPVEARHWALSAGIPIPPETYDAIQPQAVDPDVRIVAPELFSEVAGHVKVSGTAAGEDFISYRLLAGQGLNPREWIEITHSDQPVVNGLLAEWDTDGLAGLYALQLVVTRADQRVDTAVTQVTIAPAE